MMRRREFITLLGGAAATLPLAAQAQQRERMRRIGVLMQAPTTSQAQLAGFPSRAGRIRLCRGPERSG
jgi:putative tryptophan/tyrosine transport system substrate-binding protein